MNDSEFEWDDAKASSNYAKHGVTFEAARDVFKDPFAIERLDARFPSEEQRFVIIGMVEGQLLYVVYVSRDVRIWLIFRPAGYQRRAR